MKKKITYNGESYFFKESSGNYIMYKSEDGSRAILVNPETEKVTHVWNSEKRVFFNIKNQKALNL